MGAWPPVSVETLHLAEIKHLSRMKSFRGMQSFHVVAAGGAVASRERACEAARDSAAAAKLAAFAHGAVKCFLNEAAPADESAAAAVQRVKLAECLAPGRGVRFRASHHAHDDVPAHTTMRVNRSPAPAARARIP